MTRMATWTLPSSLGPAYLCDDHRHLLLSEHPNLDIRYLVGEWRGLISCDLCRVLPLTQGRNQPADDLGQGRKAA